MKEFWVGFIKRAGTIEDWEKESIEADKKTKTKKEPPPDPARNLQSMPPDTYWRSWP